MRTLGDFVGRQGTPQGATYRWRTLAGSTVTVHVRLSSNSQTLVKELDEAEVERVIHGIARFLAVHSEHEESDTCLALHHTDRSGGDSFFGQLLEKLMAERVLTRKRLEAITAAHPELRPIQKSFADLWFDREGEYL